MSTASLFLGLILSTPARADAPVPAPAAHVWVREDVPLKRWPDADTTVATLEAGTEVEVVVDDGELLRVRRGTDFGWIPAAVASREPVQVGEADQPGDAAQPGGADQPGDAAQPGGADQPGEAAPPAE